LNGELVVVWPLSLVPVFGGRVLNPLLHSDRFAAGPAVKDGVEMGTVLPQLASEIVEVAKRLRVFYWSIRIDRNSGLLKVAPQCGFEIKSSPECGIILHTSEKPEALWKRMPHGGLRTCVRKAEREGVEVNESVDFSDLRNYIAVKTSRDGERGVTEEDAMGYDELSDGIHRMLVSRVAKLFLASHQARIIGGALFFYQHDRAYLWSMGSLHSAWRMHPNHMLIWYIIKWANDSGINRINLGTVFRTSGSYYFVKRNLADYEIVDHVVLTLPISRTWYRFRTAYYAVCARGLWPPRSLMNWVYRRTSGKL
jgi:hypothetical protein